MFKLLCRASCALTIGLVAATSFAQTWPTHPITFVVPFPPGNSTDLIARAVGAEIGKSLGQAVIVVNKPGAGGNIAANFVVQSPADGYTLLVATNSVFAANVSLYSKLPYDPLKDFAPIVRLSTQPTALLVRPDFPAHTMSEFLAYARAHSDKMSGGYSSASTQVALSALQHRAGLKFVSAPYAGVPQTITDLMGGTLDFTMADLGTAITQSKAGKLRMLAVMTAKRSPLVPEVPALAEALPGVDVYGWYAIAAPAGTPAAIVEKVHAAALSALKQPNVATSLAGFGMTAAPMDAAGLSGYMKEEVERWSALIREAGIQPQ